MNEFMRYPVSRTRGRVFLSLCALVMLFGVAAAVKIGPPLYRIADRRYQLWQARKQWGAVLKGEDPGDGAPFCNLRVPTAGLDLPVLGRSSKAGLSRLPCISDACSDKERAPVIVAHRDLHFRPLQSVKVGERVFITRRSGEEVEYRILQLHVIDPNAAEAMAEDVQPGTLMLVTCYPFRYIGPAPERFVVVCIRC
jgi:LPXTG-site transpeptidase (sortase) family protein